MSLRNGLKILLVIQGVALIAAGSLIGSAIVTEYELAYPPATVRTSQSTTNPKVRYRREICRYNIRVCDPKAFYSVGPNGLPFGANLLDDKNMRRAKLWIFEDELSTMSGYQVLSSSQKGKPESIPLGVLVFLLGQDQSLHASSTCLTRSGPIGSKRLYMYTITIRQV